MSTFNATKDSGAVLDYVIDWSTWLGADTISASTWTVDTGLTKASIANTTTTATVWVSGGTAGTSYNAVNHITTTGGREDDRTIVIYVLNK